MAKLDYEDFLYHNSNPHLGKSLLEVDKVLDNMHSSSSFNKDHIVTMGSYTSGSSKMNKDLINNNLDINKLYNGKTVADVDKLANSKQLPSMVAYSGLADHTPKGGSVMKMPAFTSGTIDPIVADKYAKPSKGEVVDHKHILRIHVPEGHPGVYVGNNIEKTATAGESEVLLPRDIRLKIHDKPTRFTDSKNVRTHVWDASIVPSHLSDKQAERWNGHRHLPLEHAIKIQPY